MSVIYKSLDKMSDERRRAIRVSSKAFFEAIFD